MAFFSAKHLGAGQFYLMTIKDKDGNPLDGSKHLSPERAGRTHRSSSTGRRPSTTAQRTRSSATCRVRAAHRNTPGLQKNADGSVDVYFGPKAPAGKESNWVPTNPSGRFEVLFRFYGPEKPLFDKTWRLPDIERIAAQ